MQTRSEYSRQTSICGGQTIICYLQIEVCVTWAGTAGRGMSAKILNKGQSKPSNLSIHNIG